MWAINNNNEEKLIIIEREENFIILLQKYNCLKYLKYFTRAFDYDFFTIILVLLYVSGAINNKMLENLKNF